MRKHHCPSLTRVAGTVAHNRRRGKERRAHLRLEAGGLLEFAREAVDEEAARRVRRAQHGVLEELEHHVERDEPAALHHLLQLRRARAPALQLFAQQVAGAQVREAVALDDALALRALPAARPACAPHTAQTTSAIALRVALTSLNILLTSLSYV